MAKKADGQEIKKSFRRLAHAYHPDKNPDNTPIASYFHEIQEAYNVLSDPISRRLYDNELAKLGYSFSPTPIITSQFLLEEVEKLIALINSVEDIQVNKNHVSGYLNYLFSSNNVAILLKEDDRENIALLLEKSLKILASLDIAAFLEIEDAFFTLSNNNPYLLSILNAFREKKKREAQYKVILPFLIVVITILLCIGMYLYSKE